MSEFIVCLYCKKHVTDHYSNLCCHSVDVFVKTAKNVYRMNTKMLDDFIYTQPVYLVQDSLMECAPIKKDSLIPIDFYKVRDLVVKYIVKN